MFLFLFFFFSPAILFPGFIYFWANTVLTTEFWWAWNLKISFECLMQESLVNTKINSIYLQLCSAPFIHIKYYYYYYYLTHTNIAEVKTVQIIITFQNLQNNLQKYCQTLLKHICFNFYGIFLHCTLNLMPSITNISTTSSLLIQS